VLKTFGVGYLFSVVCVGTAEDSAARIGEVAGEVSSFSVSDWFDEAFDKI